jgi:XTP/dITP diphosphohydrolase
MHSLVFATNNAHKVAEIQAGAGNLVQIIPLKEAGIVIEIPEPYETLEENAREKSGTIHRLTGKDCFSEDTGLEVDALNGEPGVHSAHYAGPERSDEKNINLLLSKLQGKASRAARFRTVISLIWQGKEYSFEGICTGWIANEPAGEKGFGYDPIFIPEGSDKTFAQMNMEEKNGYSHRKKAFAQMLLFLQKNA